MLDLAQITLLASQAVAFLTPLLGKVADGAAEKVGESVISSILDKLKAKLLNTAAAQDAVEDLRQQPTDADTQAVLRKQLSKAIQSNPALVEQIQAWLAESKSAALKLGIDLSHSTQNATIVGNNNRINQVQGNGNTVS